MEWTTVTVLIALVGLVSVFVGAAVKITAASTKLTVVVEKLDARLTMVETANTESHRRIWTELETHTAQIVDLDKRTAILETK